MVQEEIRTRTYEELIINRIVRAFEIMDNSNHPLAKEQFDEVIDEIEMLFKIVPVLDEALQTKKGNLMTAVKNSYNVSERTCALIENDYLKKIQANKDEYEIEWGFRKDMLESILNVLNQYQLIPFSNPSYAEIESSTTPAPATIEEQPLAEGTQLTRHEPQPSELDIVQNQLAQLKQQEAELKAQEEQQMQAELRKLEQMKASTRKTLPPKQ